VRGGGGERFGRRAECGHGVRKTATGVSARATDLSDGLSLDQSLVRGATGTPAISQHLQPHGPTIFVRASLLMVDPRGKGFSKWRRRSVAAHLLYCPKVVGHVSAIDDSGFVTCLARSRQIFVWHEEVSLNAPACTPGVPSNNL